MGNTKNVEILRRIENNEMVRSYLICLEIGAIKKFLQTEKVEVKRVKRKVEKVEMNLKRKATNSCTTLAKFQKVIKLKSYDQLLSFIETSRSICNTYRKVIRNQKVVSMTLKLITITSVGK